MAVTSYDTIVAGLGAMGSATLYHLARRGQRVLGLEQFAPGHDMGSSQGDSRIIREQYFEHPLYVPLVQRAYELWRELEARSGESLLTVTGGLMIGQQNGTVVTGTLRSATTHGLAHEVLGAAEVRKRFPAFALRDDLVAVLDPRAGYLDADACNSAHLRGAISDHGEIRGEEKVLEWEAEGDGVRVVTTRGSYTAGQLVISAGAWASELLHDVRLPLTIERQVLFWMDADAHDTSYDKDRFPIYAYEYKPGHICYGIPRLARGIKAAVMHSGEIAPTPGAVRRTVDDGEVATLREALRPVLPSLSKAQVRASKVCLFTNTPDGHFVLDRHPEHPQVFISSPCSGHGFKFASAIGELHADLLTTGTTSFDLSPFTLNRF